MGAGAQADARRTSRTPAAEREWADPVPRDGKPVAFNPSLGAARARCEILIRMHSPTGIDPARVGPPPEPNVISGVATAQVAIGGTLFANALSMAAARSALLELLAPDAYERTAEIGARMAAGLREAIDGAGLGWSVVQLGARTAYFFTPTPPLDAAASRAADDPDLRALIRVCLANRGIWESGWWLGPTVSVAHTAADVDE